jgi:hypothetical protein
MSPAGLGRKNDSADEDQQEFTISLSYPEGKKQLGRPNRRWEENIKMDLREVGWGGMAYIDLAQVMNFRRP